MSRKLICCLIVVLSSLLSSIVWAGGPIRDPRPQQCAAPAPSVPKTYPYPPYGHPGPYPIYQEQGVSRLGVGVFNLTTGTIAVPFRVGDVFLDRCSRPPEYVPGPVNPYRAYCTPEIWVPPWQPSTLCAPAACPPRIGGRIVAPEAPPLPKSYAPNQTPGPYADRPGQANVQMVAQPEPKQKTLSAFW